MSLLLLAALALGAPEDSDLKRGYELGKEVGQLSAKVEALPSSEGKKKCLSSLKEIEKGWEKIEQKEMAKKLQDLSKEIEELQKKSLVRRPQFLPFFPQPYYSPFDDEGYYYYPPQPFDSESFFKGLKMLKEQAEEFNKSQGVGKAPKIIVPSKNVDERIKALEDRLKKIEDAKKKPDDKKEK